MAASEAHTIAFSLSGSIALGDLPGLCERISRLLERTGAEVVFCDVRNPDADAVTVDALARLQLAARRRGCEVRLRRSSEEFRQLVGFMGLADVLPQTPD
jgi:MFS superfamily sulfate permease-like transporter